VLLTVTVNIITQQTGIRALVWRMLKTAAVLYPGKYSLTIKDKDNIFNAELKLDLTC